MGYWMVLLALVVLLLDLGDLFQRLLHQGPQPEDDVGGHHVHHPVPDEEEVGDTL